MEGSPPHTRGILRTLSQAVSDLRFTPAYAGNTDYNAFLTMLYKPELLKSTARSPASRQRSGKKTQLTASHSRAVRRYTHLYPFL